VGLVNDKRDVVLDERVRRAADLAESEEPGRFDLGWILPIMFAYRERKFRRGLGCECERKNDLRGIGDEVFPGKQWTRSHLSRWEFGLDSRGSPSAVNSRGMRKALQAWEKSYIGGKCYSSYFYRHSPAQATS
jgi:hypothetical protein